MKTDTDCQKETKQQRRNRIYRERRLAGLCVRRACENRSWEGHVYCQECYTLDMKRREKFHESRRAQKKSVDAMEACMKQAEQQEQKAEQIIAPEPEPPIYLAPTREEALWDWLNSVQDGTPSRVMRAKRLHYAKLAGIEI